jgi:hypothetical protein
MNRVWERKGGMSSFQSEAVPAMLFESGAGHTALAGGHQNASARPGYSRKTGEHGSRKVLLRGGAPELDKGPAGRQSDEVYDKVYGRHAVITPLRKREVVQT